MEHAEYCICTDTEGDKQIATGWCSVVAIAVFSDGVNNPEFSLHDGTAGTDPAPFASVAFKATDLDYKGITLAFRGDFYDGIYFNHVGGANYQVTVWFIRNQ